MDDQGLLWVGFVLPLWFALATTPAGIGGIIGLVYKSDKEKPVWFKALCWFTIVLSIIPFVIIALTLSYVRS